MKFWVILVVVLISNLGCQVIYYTNDELLFAAIDNPQSDKLSTKILIKIRDNDIFSVTAYELKLIHTGRNNGVVVPFVRSRYHIDKNVSGDNRIFEYIEVDLPSLDDLQRWRVAIDKNEPVVLYPVNKT